jgi:hypothetical protein
MVQFGNFNSREKRRWICILAVLGPQCSWLEEELSAWSTWVTSVTLLEAEGLTAPQRVDPATRSQSPSLGVRNLTNSLFYGEIGGATKLPGRCP